MILTTGKKLAIGLSSLFIVLIVVLISIGYAMVTKSLPNVEGQVKVPGLKQDVQVYRDAFGVPHIVAATETDLMLAAGYVQAQDRLWQMDILRRVAAGRLSEIFGSKTLEVDKVLRTVGLSHVAREQSDSLTSEERDLLQSYCDGVNAFMEEHAENYPIEFVLLGYRPDPWTVEHSLSVSRLIGFQLCMGWYVDATYGRILDTVGYSMAQEILPRYPDRAPTIVKSPRSLSNHPYPGTTGAYDEKDFALLTAGDWPRRMAAFEEGHHRVREILGFEGLSVGSNSWVVSGRRSETGQPLLANDPHLGHGLPATWYEMHLVGGRFDVTGFALPGVPWIVLGNNRHVAWAFTNVQADDADFYREKVNAKGQYYFNGAWRNLRYRDERILIRDSAEVLLRVALTHRGPIVSGAYGDILAESDAVSWRWVGHEHTTEWRAVLGMNLSANVYEFRESTRSFRVPGQNIVFADRDGHIGYQCAVSLPIRKNGNGIGLADGTGDLFDWRGFVPFDQLPWMLDPPEGYIASANNRTAGNWFPYFIGHYWEHPSRSIRIEEFLASKERFSMDDFRALQSDLYSFHAAEVVPFILSACEADSIFIDPRNDVPHQTYLFLKHWDRIMARESQGAAIFASFFGRLLINTYRDEMGENVFRSFVRLGNIPNRVTTQILEYRNSLWWDDRETQEREDRDAIIRRSMSEAMDELTALCGSDPGGWTWEKLHTITFEHPLGKQKPLDHFFNVGPFPIGGDVTTVNNAQHRYSDSTFKVVLGPSMRRLVDLGNLDRPWTVLTLGQSGQLYSPHYADQVTLWLSVSGKTVSMVPAEFMKNARHLTLEAAN